MGETEQRRRTRTSHGNLRLNACARHKVCTQFFSFVLPAIVPSMHPAEPMPDDDAPPVRFLTTRPCKGNATWTYSDALAAAIADLYVDADAGGLWGLCADMPDVIPPATVIHAWKRQYPAFGLMMREAEKVRAERLVEQCLVIADTGIGQTPRLALQVAVRQAMAGQLDPARFGKGAGSGGAPAQLASDPQPVALEMDDATLASIAAQGLTAAAP